MNPIHIISYQSQEYLDQVQLRTNVLRTPLGLTFSKEDLAKDEKDIMLGYFDEKTIIGCCQLKPLEDGVFQLRQMAVDDAYQGRQIGKALIDAAEQYVLHNWGNKITLHARKVAMPFYQKLGYLIEGPEFTEVGIPHFSMYKNL